MAETLSGIGVSPGVAAGPVAQMAPPPVVPTDATPSGDPEAESQAAMDAMRAVAHGLEERASRAPGEAASVLAAQAMMAEDPTLAAKVTEGVQGGKAAVTAVADAFEDFRAMLAAAGPYMAERVADLDDLRNRTIATLLGVPMPGVPDPGHPFVLVALDLAPADTATLDADRVRAIITEEGGPTSHTAILAKSLGIPAVVTCHGATAIPEGETVLVDGTEGSVAVAPEQAAVQEALDAEEARPDLGRAPGAAAGQHRRRQGPGPGVDGRQRGRWAVPDRVPVPRPAQRADPAGAAGGLPAGVRRLRRPQGGRADPGRRRRQAAGVRDRARRAQPGPGRARPADLAAAPRAARGPAGSRRRGRRQQPGPGVGDGADGVDRGRGGRLRRAGPRPRAVVGRGHDRGPGRGHPGPARGRGLRLPLDRDQRPVAVHLRGRPDGRGAGRPARPVAAGPPRPGPGDRRGRQGPGQAGRGVR